jgi:hypothetical protein
MVIEDFSAGVDLRRSAVTAQGRSLRKLVNAFVNGGGEIEKREAFILAVPAGNLAGTYGLRAISGALYVFGAGSRPAGLNAGLGYQQLAGASIQRISDTEVFNNKLYVVVQQSPGVYKHYYDGVLVTEAPNSAVVMAHRSKMYAVASNIVYFSGLDDPVHWTSGSGGTVGAGFIQVDSADDGMITLMGMSPYYDQLALLGRNSIQLWSMDEDPKLNQLIQTLAGIGLITPLGVGRYATGDVLFLHDSGIRSIRARDSSNAASVNDIGSPIDEELRTFIQTAKNNNSGGAPIPPDLVGIETVTEPTTGQFWVNMGNSVYVLSIAPSAKISAWSRHDPGFKVDYFAVSNSLLWLRSGDNLYTYGGGYGGYDNSVAEVITPMNPGTSPATNKMFTAMDAALEGTWTFEVGTDPSIPDTRELVATITGPSFSQQSIGLQNTGTHIGVRVTNSDAARSRIGNMIFHYREGAVD